MAAKKPAGGGLTLNPESPYWNPWLETLDRSRLRRLQLLKFQRLLDWAYERSPFYRELYRRAGLEPGDVQTLEDVARVPRTDKALFRSAQAEGPFPFGQLLCLPPEEVVEFHQTSGTTGRPLFQADSWPDWEWQAEAWAFILWAQGYRPPDRVFLPFGYNIFIAFWTGHYAAEKIGCEVVPGGVLDTEARILKIQELRCTAMMGTPTYLLHMARVARDKMGIDPAKLAIDKITCAGEPGASIPSTKKRLEEAWGAKVFDHAGATEIGAWGFECADQPGGLHVNEALFLVEIEDVLTGEPIAEPGRPGKMIVSTFDRYAQPCIRFDSQDIIEWADKPCSCGRTFKLIKGGVQGRADDITKVKGVLLSPAAVEAVVRSFDQLGDEYQVVVERIDDADRITLKIELRPGAESERVKTRLRDELRLKTNLGYAIEVHPLGALPRYPGKARRFLDLRKAKS
ncbi:MAG: phenylacetate--CoA ligase family protein [Proteobacteria bacterium]|nr:phenylacetate--CoA ligase family protein [Pseudomonadota bacterium]MBU1740015.1 phenylacetate--CoA ligase family protein [Pseudomonadota bacterium]